MSTIVAPSLQRISLLNEDTLLAEYDRDVTIKDLEYARPMFLETLYNGTISLSQEIYDKNPNVHRVIEMLKKGFDGESFEDIADYLIKGNRPDPYMCLIDFDSYIEAYHRMDSVYKDGETWNRMSLMNIARSGFFAADRSIDDYAKNIWDLKPVKL